MTRPQLNSHAVIVGGGLAGIAAALDCLDHGVAVTVLERRGHLGGLTWSFTHNGLVFDNGQHVFLRCCHEYLNLLDRIGAADDVEIQARLDIPVLAPASEDGPAHLARLRRSAWPAPLHLASSLMRFPYLPLADRLRLGQAVVALRRLDLDDPRLDQTTFADWLRSHGQSTRAIHSVWDLITVPTVNLSCEQASLAMGAKVFQTGLLSRADAADIGWSRVPLSRLHGERAESALIRGGAKIRTGCRVVGVEATPDGGFRVGTDTGPVDADAVIVALAHHEAASVLPDRSLANQDRLDELGESAVVDVHLVFDRMVSPYRLMAGHSSAVQWVFDRTSSAGLDPRDGQYLAVSLSAADDLLSRRPDDLIRWIHDELGRLLPGARHAHLVDSLVTKERRATFAARPGTATLRPGAATSRPGLAVAGAWTRTGWPATMEGAVRSGRAAATAVLPHLMRSRSNPTHTEEVA
jgi:squalene-associated FAD-dependent desaturase